MWALENEDPDPSSYYFTANQVTVAELARLDLCSRKSVLGEAPAIITWMEEEKYLTVYLICFKNAKKEYILFC